VAWAYIAGSFVTTGSTTFNSPVTLALGAATNVGDRIVVLFGGNGTVAVTDNLNSGPYSLDASAGYTWILSKIVTVAGTPTISVVGTGVSGGFSAVAYSGTAAGVDVNAGNSATVGTSPSSGATKATRQASELVVGGWSDFGWSQTVSAGSGFTLRGKHDSDGSTYEGAIEDKDSGTLGTTQTATFTVSVGVHPMYVVCAVYPTVASTTLRETGGVGADVDLTRTGITLNRQTGAVGADVDLNRTGVTLNRQTGAIGVKVDLKPIIPLSGAVSQSQSVSLVVEVRNGSYACLEAFTYGGLESFTYGQLQMCPTTGNSYGSVVSTAQPQVVRLVAGSLRLTSTQATAVALVVLATKARTVTATQAQAVALARAFAYVRTAVQPSAVSRTYIPIYVKLVSAVQPQSSVLARRAVSLTRQITQAQVFRLGQSGGFGRVLVVTTSVKLVRTGIVVRALAQAQVASGFIGRGYQRTVATTQAQAVRLQRKFFTTVTLRKQNLQAQSVSLGRVVGRALLALEPTAPRLFRQIRLTRSVAQAHNARIAGLPVKLQGVAAQQTRSLALGRAISLIRSIAQPTFAYTGRQLQQVLVLQEPTSASVQRFTRLTRAMAQPTAVSLTAQNVTPRIFLTLNTSIGQSLHLTQATGGKPARSFEVDARKGNFTVAGRTGGFKVRGNRGVLFEVEKR